MRNLIVDIDDIIDEPDNQDVWVVFQTTILKNG